MKTITRIIFLLFLIHTFLFSQEFAFNGKWKLIKQKSSDIDYFQTMTLDFSIKKDEVTIKQELGPRRKYEEKMILKTNGIINKVEIKDNTFPTHIFMGLKMPGGKKEVKANWLKNNILEINEKYEIQCSQGSRPMDIIHSFELSADKNLLIYKITRNTRKEGPDLKLIFKRIDYNNAFVMRMSDDWEIDSKLPEQACLISLQGIVNEEKPNLYFLFGPDYPFNYVQDLYNYLENQRHFNFIQLNSLEQALNIFKDYVKGYIIWDKKVRTSLIVAYTLAGLEKGIVITEELIPLAKKYGLKQIEDFRGKFTGWSDYEIYSWAYDKYWDKCSRDVIVWLGGEHGSVMKPAVADYGMMKKVFFTDLSGRASDTLEYNLSKKLLSQMKPLGQVMGWHSYKKDLEEEWVTLTSSYALTVDGLNTLPNTSFLVGVPASPGFIFKNNHNIKSEKQYIFEKKTYVALVQTDGLGLGAWVKPGRGTIPYAWEVSMNCLWLSPAMLEYFYSQATPNDYFIGCLSGSAYMYPKAFPKKWLPKEIEKAKNLMEKLDLNVFEIMDYSEDKTEAGENDLPEEIVDQYYKGMPNAIGFLNGYFASHTFSIRDKRPFISYDYYLSKEKPEDEAAADLKELAEINSNRPYFLLVHVRESSDITRVKSICDKLGPGFEIIPLDVFLKLAGENPTFEKRYMDKK
jgi:hypothetical protein